MARYIYQDVVLNEYGNVKEGATITVKLAGGDTLATIYAAVSGGSAISGSTVTSGSDGTFLFYVDTSDYAASQRFKVAVSLSGATAQDAKDYVQIIPYDETTHATGDGSDHADVATNTTHTTGDGSDHADVATNTTHTTGDGSDHADVATNTTHRGLTNDPHSSVDDTAYAAGWNGVTAQAPSKNTVYDKFEVMFPEFVTPEQYGAVGDGSTDDTAACQSAIDSGKTVIVCRQSYKVTELWASATSKVFTGGGTFVQKELAGATATISAATISFSDSDPDTINDSGNGLVAAGFASGQKIGVNAATQHANNHHFEVDTVAVGALTLIATDSLTAEGADATVVTVKTSGCILYGQGKNDLLIEDLIFTGAGGGAYVSENDAIQLVNCDRATVKNCKFSAFLGHPIYFKDSDDIEVSHNTSWGNGSGIYLQGCVGFDISNNKIKAPHASAGFNIGISLESTDGHSYGVCSEGVISLNRIRDINDGQSIHGHAGRYISVIGNTIMESNASIIFNPINVNDLCNHITIVGNICHCAESGASNAYSAIGVGGGSGYVPDYIVIANNVTYNGNRVQLNVAHGGIGIGYADHVSIKNNTIVNSYGNGIAVFNPCTKLHITGNQIRTVNTANGENNGILTHSGIAADNVSGLIENNYIISATNGVDIESNQYPGLIVKNNRFESVTTRYVATANAITDGIGQYVAAETTPSVAFGEITSMRIANSGSVTITDFPDGVLGQRLVTSYADVNTTLTRANALLSGGANYTSTVEGILTLRFDGTNWVELYRSATAS